MVEPATTQGSRTTSCDVQLLGRAQKRAAGQSKLPRLTRVGPRGTLGRAACLQGIGLHGFAQGGVRNAKSQPGGKFNIPSSLSCALTVPHKEGSCSCTEIAKENFNWPFHRDRDLCEF